VSRDLGPGAGRPQGADLALAVAVVVTAVPSVLLGWTAGRLALGRGARRWHLAVAGVVSAVPLIACSPRGVAAWAAADALRVVRGTPGGLAPSWALLWAGAGLLARLALRTAPAGIPAGLAVAAVRMQHMGVLHTDGALDPARRRQLERAQRRDRQRTSRAAERAAIDPASDALAVSVSGDLPAAWRRGRDLAIPPRVAGLPRLVVGRPGQGKTRYIGREVYLAALAGRRVTCLDCKGEPGFTEEISAAYQAGRPDATVHVWPGTPLNGWTGGPAAVVNRLLACWEFDLASQWYREVVSMALRLALHAPGPEVASSAELVARMQPGALGRLWNGHRDEQEWVRAHADKFNDVAIRVTNLMASLGAHLDGDDAIGTADLTILSLPVMANEHDAAAILRVAMADLAHYVAKRKRPGDRDLIVVDEASAVAGGRQYMIHLAERGRSADAAVVLAVQSRRGLGDDDDADKLIGAAGMVALFGTAEPEDVLKLAGTRREVEVAAQLEDGRLTGRGVATEHAAYRVDANDVRALEPGWAYLLAGGRAELCKVIQAPGSRAAPASRPALLSSPRWGRPALLPRRWRP
jgi:hypothetical protein